MILTFTGITSVSLEERRRSYMQRSTSNVCGETGNAGTPPIRPPALYSNFRNQRGPSAGQRWLYAATS